MELMNLLSKQLTVSDLFEYVEDLTKESSYLVDEKAPQMEIDEVNAKVRTATAFLTDFLFDGNRDIVDDIIEAETEARAKVGRDKAIPFD